jgi:hypothetical protein
MVSSISEMFFSTLALKLLALFHSVHVYILSRVSFLTGNFLKQCH